jgi:hypothetical protein
MLAATHDERDMILPLQESRQRIAVSPKPRVAELRERGPVLCVLPSQRAARRR